MKVTLRQARMADFNRLIEIWQMEGFYYPPWDRIENLTNKLKLQPELFLVAEANSIVIGGVIGTYDGWGAYINHLAVHPMYRECGVDKSLLLEIEKRFKRLGVHKAFVFTIPGHPENKLYKQTDYTEWGISMGLEKDI